MSKNRELDLRDHLPARLWRAPTVPLGLATAVVLIQVLLAEYFAARGVFEYYDILFDTDPSTRMLTFAHGWPSREGIVPFLPNSVHPWLHLMFAPVFRACSAIAGAFGLGPDAWEALREQLALLLAPAASAANLFLLSAVLTRIGVPLVERALLLGIAATSASSLVLGSVPDHWVLGGLCATAGFRLMVSADPRSRRTLTGWLALGCVAAGITITNIASVSVQALMARWRADGRLIRSALQVAAAAASIVILVLASGYAADRVLGVPSTAERSHATGGLLSPAEYANRALSFVMSVGDAFAPPRPDTRPNHVPGQRFDLQFTLEGPRGWTQRLGSYIVLGALIVGGVGLARATRTRPLAAAAIGILGFYALLLTVWGSEPFLYSPLWHPASVMLLAGLCLGDGGRSRPRRIVLAVLLGVVLVSSLRLLVEMDSVFLEVGLVPAS